MNDAIIIALSPNDIGKILSGHMKSVIFKKIPKLSPPYKVYIYCTKDKHKTLWECTGPNSYRYTDERSHNLFDRSLNGTVIGEFICNSIDEISINIVHDDKFLMDKTSFENMNRACLTPEQLHDLIRDKFAGAWRLSELKEYKPAKQLSDFTYKINDSVGHITSLTRSPVGWQYVQNIDNIL